MSDLCHELLLRSSDRTPQQEALAYQGTCLDYGTLVEQVVQIAAGFLRIGLGRSERVAIYIGKRFESVIAAFAAAAAGGVFVPVNPLLKPEQVAHILKDCNVRILVTSVDRLKLLTPVLSKCHDLHTVVVAGGGAIESLPGLTIIDWDQLVSGTG